MNYFLSHCFKMLNPITETAISSPGLARYRETEWIIGYTIISASLLICNVIIASVPKTPCSWFLRKFERTKKAVRGSCTIPRWYVNKRSATSFAQTSFSPRCKNKKPTLNVRTSRKTTSGLRFTFDTQVGYCTLRSKLV